MLADPLIPGLPAAMWQWALVAFLVAACVVRMTWSWSRAAARWSGMLVVVALGGVCMITWPGMLGAQKMVTGLVMPAGFVWFALAGLSVAAWAEWHRTLKWGLLGLLGLFTVVGNGSLSKGLFTWLEHDYAEIDPFNEPPYDALVVLGGMTSEGPGPRAQLTGTGDRLVLAARLFRQGQTQHVVCTGVQIKGYGFDQTEPGPRSALLLEQLGVPPDRIVILKGHNTKEELREIDRLSSDKSWPRIGLVTSAWHMPRAMRLARQAGVAVHPVPADFLGRKPHLSRTELIPSTDGFTKMERLAKEALAWVVGR